MVCAGVFLSITKEMTMLKEAWYNVVRHYTCADLRSTRGRTTTANRAHPAEHIMSEGHDIINEANGKGDYLYGENHGISWRLYAD